MSTMKIQLGLLTVVLALGLSSPAQAGFFNRGPAKPKLTADQQIQRGNKQIHDGARCAKAVGKVRGLRLGTAIERLGLKIQGKSESPQGVAAAARAQALKKEASHLPGRIWGNRVAGRFNVLAGNTRKTAAKVASNIRKGFDERIAQPFKNSRFNNKVLQPTLGVGEVGLKALWHGLKGLGNGLKSVPGKIVAAANSEGLSPRAQAAIGAGQQPAAVLPVQAQVNAARTNGD